MMEKVEGLAALDHALGELPKATARATLVRAGKKALEPFLTDVKAMAPVDADPANTPKRPPGTLRDSYVIGTRLNKSQAKTVRREGKNFAEVYAGTNDPAGVQTEFGNAHQAAQPHGRPAWDGTKQQVLKSVGNLIWDEIYKSAKRLAAKRGKA
jgi:hypothetical protein